MRVFLAHWWEADGAQPGLDGAGAVEKDLGGVDAGGAQAAGKRGRGIGEHGLGAGLEDGKIGRGIADVGKSDTAIGAWGELLLKGGELVGAGEIVGGIGGEHAGKERGVVGGDAVGQRGVGGGGEKNPAPGGVLVEEEFEQRLVVGEVLDVEGDGRGDVLFEGGLALGEPAGDLEQGARVLADEGEHRIDEGVGLDEGSVEVDAERGLGGVGHDMSLSQITGAEHQAVL